MTPCEC